VQELSQQGLETLGNTVMVLAENELLDAHKNAIAIRLASF
jgi:histidinol dehydrogenase